MNNKAGVYTLQIFFFYSLENSFTQQNPFHFEVFWIFFFSNSMQEWIRNVFPRSDSFSIRTLWSFLRLINLIKRTEKGPREKNVNSKMREICSSTMLTPWKKRRKICIQIGLVLYCCEVAYLKNRNKIFEDER